MELRNSEIEAVEAASKEAETDKLEELALVRLALVGGGIGDVVFG